MVLSRELEDTIFNDLATMRFLAKLEDTIFNDFTTKRLWSDTRAGIPKGCQKQTEAC
jgi:hypothetical protein